MLASRRGREEMARILIVCKVDVEGTSPEARRFRDCPRKRENGYGTGFGGGLRSFIHRV